MDRITDEGRRIMALATLRLTEARARAAGARLMLDQLRARRHDLTTADAHDFACELWAEFQGVDGRALDMPIDLQAGVFAQTALFLDEPTVLRLARETWGDTDLDITCGLDSVVWMPADDVVIATAGHVHTDGTTGQIVMVVSPLGATRGTR